LVLIIAFILVVGTIFLIEAYIIIALITGYIFVPMMIFKPLEFLWNDWLKFLISSALAYFIVFVVLKMFSLFMVNTLMNYIQAINVHASYNLSSIINELIYTFILFVFGYLVTKIPAIAGEIVSGMPNMNVSVIIAPVVNSFNKISSGGGKIASKTVGEIKAAAGKGSK
jgi:type IV secretory pathway VirB6-like protein